VQKCSVFIYGSDAQVGAAEINSNGVRGHSETFQQNRFFGTTG
jgi:hypothetical protein